MVDIESKKITNNLIWGYAEKGLTYAISFITSLVLARILAPEIFGTITLLNVIISFIQIILDCGLSNALIQKKDADDIDFSTIFWINLISSIILYGVVYLIAPSVAAFYEDESITLVLRVLGIWIISYGIKNIQSAYVTKHLLFKKMFWASLFGTLVSGVVSIYLAIKGYGLWSLVSLHITDNVLDMIIISISLKFKPKFIFDFKRFKTLFSFGSKLFVATIFDTTYNDVKSLIIGKVYTKADFAYYEKGKRYPSVIQALFNSVIDKITFSIMSNAQDENEKMYHYAKIANSISSYFNWPMMLGLAAITRNLVILLITDKWIDCVPYMMIFCITSATTPISNLNINILKSKGEGNKLLKKELIKKSFAFIIMLIALRFSPLAIAIGELIYCPFACLFNQFNGQKLVNYSIKEQWMDILPSLLMALVMGIVVYFLGNINLPLFIVLLIQIFVGIFIYLLESLMFKPKSFKLILEYVRKGKKNA